MWKGPLRPPLRTAVPRPGRDPFDRMLIAQAVERGQTIVTRDTRFTDYGVATITA